MSKEKRACPGRVQDMPVFNTMQYNTDRTVPGHDSDRALGAPFRPQHTSAKHGRVGNSTLQGARGRLGGHLRCCTGEQVRVPVPNPIPVPTPVVQTQQVPVPTPVPVTRDVRVPVPVPQHVPVPNPVLVTQVQRVPVPVPVERVVHRPVPVPTPVSVPTPAGAVLGGAYGGAVSGGGLDAGIGAYGGGVIDAGFGGYGGMYR